MKNKYNGLRAYQGVRKAMLGTAAGLASLIGPSCFEWNVNLYVDVQPGAVVGMEQGAVDVQPGAVVGMEQGAVTVDGGLGDVVNSEQGTGILGHFLNPRK